MFFLWFLILDTNIVDKLLLSHFSVLLAVERLFRRSDSAVQTALFFFIPYIPKAFLWFVRVHLLPYPIPYRHYGSQT